MVLVARAVSPAEFGLLAAVLGVATLLQTTFDMGVQTFTTKERAAYGDVGTVATALRFNSVTALLVLAIATLLLVVAAIVISPAIYLLLPLAIWVSAERTADVRLVISLADGDLNVNGINLVGRRALAIVIFIASQPLAVQPLLGYSLSVAIGGMASALFAYSYVRTRVTASPSLSFRSLLRQSWPYWVNSVATQARNLDSTVVAVVAGPLQAGLFSVSSRLTSPLRLLPTALSMVLLPNAARGDGSKVVIGGLLRLTAIAVGVSSAIYAVIFLMTPGIIAVVLGSTYADSALPVQIVLCGLPFAAVTSMLSSILQGRNHKNFVALVSTLFAVGCLAVVAVGAVVYGAVGAAIGLSGSLVLQSGAVIIGFRHLVWRKAK